MKAIGRFLCSIGWHRWKISMVYIPYKRFPYKMRGLVYGWKYWKWFEVDRRCTRCDQYETIDINMTEKMAVDLYESLWP